MISSSALFTENLYRPFVSNKPDRHFILVGRLASLIVVAGGVAFAYWVPGVIDALDLWFRIAPMMGIAFWIGLMWRWATPLGAWAATLTGFGMWWLTTTHTFIDWAASLPFAEQLNLIWQSGSGQAEIYDPWVILLYTAAATAACVVVSLVTPRVPEKKLQTFYDLTRTPIQAGEVVRQPCTLPEGVTAPQRPMLLTAFGLEIPVPSKTSMIGFLGGWVAVALMVGGFVWLMS